MNLGSHLAELRRKHAALSTKIEEEVRHPACDSLRLTELKREKLKLKEEIVRLQTRSH